MAITKQDIEKIRRILAATGAKDTSFPRMSETDSVIGTLIPVIHDGKNKTVTTEMLSAAVAVGLATKIQVNDVNYKGTLAGFIEWVASAIISGGSYSEVPSSTVIPYTNTALGTSITKVATALDFIINILYGLNGATFPTAATEDDIISLFNTNE